MTKGPADLLAQPPRLDNYFDRAKALSQPVARVRLRRAQNRGIGDGLTHAENHNCI